MEQIDREDKASRTTFRLAVGAAAAAFLAAAGLTAVLLAADDPDVQNPGDTSTTDPKLKPSGDAIRDVDFENFTFRNPCPPAGVPVTLTDGLGSTPGDETNKGFSVELLPVSYVDVDGDGAEEAVVGTFCFVQMQERAGASIGVYRLAGNGQPELVGPQLVTDDQLAERPVITGNRVTLTTHNTPQPWPDDTYTTTSEFNSTEWGPAEVVEESEGLEIGDVEFENWRYPKPCPTIKDADITFDHGSASLGDEDFRYVAEVKVGSYGDFDGDGTEDDALVVIFCHHQAAESAAAWAAVYTLGDDGLPQVVGTPLEIPDVAKLPSEMPTVDGDKLTVKMEYSDKPDQLPADVWAFDGTKFVKQ